MTSFLRTRKDRHPRNDKPRLPHEQDQSFDRPEATRDSPKVERQEIRQAYNDIESGQVDTDLRGTGGQDEANKGAGQRAAAAPRKQGEHH